MNWLKDDEIVLLAVFRSQITFFSLQIVTPVSGTDFSLNRKILLTWKSCHDYKNRDTISHLTLDSFEILLQNRVTPSEIVPRFQWQNLTFMLDTKSRYATQNRDTIPCFLDFQIFCFSRPWISHVASEPYQNVKISPKNYAVTACHQDKFMKYVYVIWTFLK